MYTKNFTSFGIKNILLGCRKLKEFSIAWAELDSEALDSVFTLLPSTLLRLNFSGFRDIKAMNDKNIAILIKNCPNLEELDLSDNTLLGTLVELKKLSLLKILTMSRCYGIEPLEFTSLTTLTMLNVFGCVTDEGVTELRNRLYPIRVNECALSSAARPTVGESVSSIWGQRTRDIY